MKYTHDLVVPESQYEDREGNTKTRWGNHGIVLTDSDGRMTVKVTSLPLTECDPDGKIRSWQGWFKVFERTPPKAKPPRQPDFDDDIPF